jgi:hypothetical protein
MEQPLHIRIQETVRNSVAAEHARKPRDACGRFAWLCNRGVNEEYQGSFTLSKKPFQFQAMECHVWRQGIFAHPRPGLRAKFFRRKNFNPLRHNASVLCMKSV